jgi:hypothetical protein
MKALFLAAAFFAATVGAASADVVVTKSPDLGPYWNPLSDNGTYVYAGSFFAPVTGTVTSLGTWLFTNTANTAPSTLVFEILGDSGGAPDPTTVLAQTDTLSYDLGALTFESASPTGSAVLTAGLTYWFAASTVGLSWGDSVYQVGGHTQNTEGIIDDGSFWFSNDPAGLNFDGQNMAPELAFSVTLAAAIPEPVSIALLGAGLAGLGPMRRRRAVGIAAGHSNPWRRFPASP